MEKSKVPTSAHTAAVLVNAFYSALLLKKNSGAELTKEVEAEVLETVLLRWKGIQEILETPVPLDLLKNSSSDHENNSQ